LEEGGALPIGLFSDLKVQLQTYDITRGSALVLYSDGVTEGENGSGEHFGLSRLNAVTREHLDKPASVIHDRVRGNLKAFMGERPQTDDSTLVVLKF
jgi:sigma-B regulation protein RsbU (phosphoserine phosphatase)